MMIKDLYADLYAWILLSNTLCFTAGVVAAIIYNELKGKYDDD